MDRETARKNIILLANLLNVSKPEEDLISAIWNNYKFEDKLFGITVKRISEQRGLKRFPSFADFKYVFQQVKQEQKDQQRVKQFRKYDIPEYQIPTQEDWDNLQKKVKKLNKRFSKEI